MGICSHFKTYWNVILFAIVPDQSNRKSLTDPLPALVPDPADGQGNEKDFRKYTSIVMNSPTSMGLIIIIKLRMMSKRFLACNFKTQPFYLHNAICCNINMKSLQLSTQ